MNACALAKFADTPCRMRADGNFDRAHWIPQQRLRQEYRTRGYPEQAIEFALKDRRIWTPACRRHHGDFDSKRLELGAGDYPSEVHEYAGEWCWFFASPREGWLPDRFHLELAPPPGLIADFAPLGKDVA